MSQFVVDASVVLVWCFPDENADLADRVAEMFRRGDSAIVPAFWPHEVLNALLVGEKRRRISGDLIRTFISELAPLPIAVATSSTTDVFTRIQSLAREHKLTSYDAAYLDLSKINEIPLATLDDDLIRGCGKAGVRLL